MNIKLNDTVYGFPWTILYHGENNYEVVQLLKIFNIIYHKKSFFFKFAHFTYYTFSVQSRYVFN